MITDECVLDVYISSVVNWHIRKFWSNGNGALLSLVEKSQSARRYTVRHSPRDLSLKLHNFICIFLCSFPFSPLFEIQALI